MERTKKDSLAFNKIVIPENVLFNSTLSDKEKLLFGIIQNLAYPNGCVASNEYLGWLLDTGKQTISNGVSSLKNEGFIDVNYERSIQTGINSRIITTK